VAGRENASGSGSEEDKEVYGSMAFQLLASSNETKEKALNPDVQQSHMHVNAQPIPQLVDHEASDHR
jgi:hypothetical protein